MVHLKAAPKAAQTVHSTAGALADPTALQRAHLKGHWKAALKADLTVH
jgi:hypothetical protein